MNPVDPPSTGPGSLTGPRPDSASALAEGLRLVVGKLLRRLREQASPGELTWPQIQVLKRLEQDGPATVTTLARAEGVRSQSMGATVSALEAAGHLSGSPDPTDGRQTILSLTEKCRAWIKASRAARQDWLHHAIQTELNPAEQRELESALLLLKRLSDS